MRNSGSAKIKAWAVLASLLASASCVIAAGRALTSSFLTAPLPPEELHLARHGGDFVINGPTFSYRVQRQSGAITGIRVVRGEREVISSSDPGGIIIDGRPLCARQNVEWVSSNAGKDKIVLQAKGTFENDQGRPLNFTVESTFYNDGVVVTQVKLLPRRDFEVRQAVAWQIAAQGAFASYLHKRRDEDGSQAVRGKLSASGAVRFSTLTSCLGVVSPTAALAIFTDSGAAHVSRAGADTARAEVTPHGVLLSQYIAQIAAGDPPLVLKAGEEFSCLLYTSPSPRDS